MNKLKQKSSTVPVAEYSLCFLIFVLFCVVVFFLFDGKSMFDYNDGLKQQYMGFVYSGNLLRTLFRNFFTDHVFEIPMWDMTMGMGSDPYITISPFNAPILSIISALIPARYSEYAFDLMIIIRLYLSGLAFLLLVNRKGYRSLNAIAGAMVYVFSSTTFVIFMQMNFSMTYILFPLLILGTDYVWTQKKSIYYVAVVTYSTTSSFYFTYMMLVLLVIYCVIRFFCEEGRSVKKFFSLFGRFVALTLISLCAGFGTIMPGMLNLFQLSRLKSHYEIPLFDPEVLRRFFAYGFSNIQADGDALIGVSAFAAVAAVCLFASKKKEPVIKWCLSLCLLSFAFPGVGSILNGFNYSSCRYIFSLILCVAYLVTVSFDSVKEFKGKLWYFSLGISLLYCAVCFIFIDNYSMVSALSLFFTVLLVGCINRFERFISQYREKLYITVIFITCMIIGFCTIHLNSQNKMDLGSVYDKVFVDGGMSLRREINDPDYRSDSINADFTEAVLNSSMAAQVNGFDFYQSNQNQFVELYYSDLAVLGNPVGFSHTGFRGRSYAEIMNACRYLAMSNELNTCIRTPYTYDLVKTDGKFSLYRAGRDVSMVYFYDNVISYDSYKRLDPVQRETNLMYSMVVDEPGQPEADIVSDIVQVPFEIEECNNLSVEGNKITVTEDKAYIRLKTENIEPGQVSVYLHGLVSSNADNYYYRNAVALTDPDNELIAIDYSAQFLTDFKYYYGNDDIVFSFEAIDEKVDSICVFFLNHGEYYIDDIQVFSRPYEQMDKTIDAFYDHAGMEDIGYHYSGNHLNISASADSGKYLYIAVPYSKGWHAKIDGETVPVIRANTAFMAVPLSAGTHNIEMTYTTPYLYEGLAVSAAGIVLYVFFYLFFEKKKIRKES